MATTWKAGAVGLAETGWAERAQRRSSGGRSLQAMGLRREVATNDDESARQVSITRGMR